MIDLRLPAAPDIDGGIVVRAPERAEAGYRVGCPSVLVDDGLWLTDRPDGAHELRVVPGGVNGRSAAHP